MKNFNEFNENNKIILDNIKQINEKESHFNISVGRARYGFKEIVYKIADECDVNINIIKLGGFLEIRYRISVSGDDNNIRRFYNYLKRLQ
jgi:hypothetical protein